jgi:hypothetical protein
MTVADNQITPRWFQDLSWGERQDIRGAVNEEALSIKYPWLSYEEALNKEREVGGMKGIANRETSINAYGKNLVDQLEWRWFESRLSSKHMAVMSLQRGVESKLSNDIRNYSNIVWQVNLQSDEFMSSVRQEMIERWVQFATTSIEWLTMKRLLWNVQNYAMKKLPWFRRWIAWWINWAEELFEQVMETRKHIESGGYLMSAAFVCGDCVCLITMIYPWLSVAQPEYIKQHCAWLDEYRSLIQTRRSSW